MATKTRTDVSPSDTAPKFSVTVKSRCIMITDSEKNSFPIAVTGQTASEMLEFISQLKFKPNEEVIS